MDLEKRSEENLKFILEELIERLDVANRSLLDPKHYDLNKYNDLKLMYDMILKKGKLSTIETQAFIDELKLVRKQS